jgi:thiol:disulfide interchange protein DsbD
MLKYKALALALLLTLSLLGQGQGSLHWNASSTKISASKYKLVFETNNNDHWEIYSPLSTFEGLDAATLTLSDSSIQITEKLTASGISEKIKSDIFDQQQFEVYKDKVRFEATIEFTNTVPGDIQTSLSFTYGKGDSFYPGEVEKFTIPLLGGKSNASRMLIPGLDPSKPMRNCGATHEEKQSSLWGIFLLGILGGLVALITPCVFPMVPLTVSFFTKHSSHKGSGKKLAILYGFFIFLIYSAFSIPFHLIGNVSPTIYNDIATNVYLNVAFFAIFIFFAISFFGFYEITLPGGLANSTNAKQGSGIAGVFFMALTLAIVSFSCTGPILGTLLVGTATEGAWPLTAGLAGFGLALGLPFGLFALFPHWLNSLPKSGGWLNTVKVVLGFIELALALKFLSNADLVAHWSIVKREIFFGIWIIIFIGLFLYLIGLIHFPHESKSEKIHPARKILGLLVLLFTLYLLPGITNTKWSNLNIVSGFPPPACYSVYRAPINCEEPLKDYNEALALSQKLNKPILIDFTGWACVNCRKMEENVWIKPEVRKAMEKFILVSLYVDDKRVLPADEQSNYTTKSGTTIRITTVGDKWGVFETENFNASSQPLYALVSPNEQLLTTPIGYTPNSIEYAAWLQCGIDAFEDLKRAK